MWLRQLIVGLTVFVLAAGTLLFDVDISVKRTELGERIISLIVTKTGLYPVVFKRAYAIDQVYQEEEITIPWGNLGVELAKAGVVDIDKLKIIYQSQGQDPADINTWFTQDPGPDSLQLNKTTAPKILNTLWALGLANNSPILFEGEMARYGKVETLASVGGWPVAKDSALNHFGKHMLVPLTTSQTALVRQVSTEVFRPCCNNSTHFPDCNHGMAMLALLEILASRSASEAQLYRAAFLANQYWFPNEYQSLRAYMHQPYIPVGDISSKSLVGYNYVSGSSFQTLQKNLQPVGSNSGASCGI